MALEQITFNIGAFNDSDAGGNNYFTDTVFEVKNQSDNTFATIYADSSGTTQIPQNGIDNVSNSRGECNFYIGDGDFYIEVGSQKKNFSTVKINEASSIKFSDGESVQDYKDANQNPYRLPTVVDIIFGLGQSNIRGYGGNTPGAPTYSTPLGRVWNGSSFMPLTSYTPTANDGTSTGSSWAAFGNKYAEETSRDFVILNCGRGSQSIAELQKGTANYTALTNFYNGAVAEILAEGNTVGKVIAMFSQGEQDSILQTTPVDYTASLSQYWSDIKADFNAEVLGIYTVGYYVNFNLIHGQAIQQAQRQFAADNDDVVIAYDKLGGFGTHNGLKVDGVHYNQRGYNIMGYNGAKTIARVVFPESNASSSEPTVDEYGTVAMNQSQAWVKYGGVIRKISADNWQVNHSKPHASSMLLSATEESDRLSVKLSGNASTVMNFAANLGGILKRNGVTASVGSGINPVSGIAGSVDVNGYSSVDVFFSATIYLRINMVAGTYDVDAQGTSFSGILANDISVTFPSIGRCDITHGETAGLATGSISGSTGRSLRVNAGASSTLVQVRDSADALVNDTVVIALPNMAIAPSSLPNTTDLNLDLIAANYGIW